MEGAGPVHSEGSECPRRGLFQEAAEIGEAEMEEPRGGVRASQAQAGRLALLCTRQLQGGSRGRGLCREAFPKAPRHGGWGGPSRGPDRSPALTCQCDLDNQLHLSGRQAHSPVKWATERMLAGAEHGVWSEALGKKPVGTLVNCLLPAFPKSLTKSLGVFIAPRPAAVRSNP